MRIFVDENIPKATVNALRDMGHEVKDIRGTSEQGMEDPAIWTKAQQERRVLVTTDKGFVQHRAESHHGILVVRLRQPNEAKIHERVLQAIKQHPEKEWPGLTVVMRDELQSVTRA